MRSYGAKCSMVVDVFCQSDWYLRTDSLSPGYNAARVGKHDWGDV
jgi:hypothetical protein